MAFAFELPFMPQQASSYAEKVDNLFLFLVGLTIFFTVSIALCEIFFAIKYRRRHKNEVPKPIEGSMKLELLWTIIPFCIAMGIFVWGTSVYFSLYHVPDQTMDIYVTGKQWMWRFQHPEGQREINELHVPVGRRVKLTMATEDVIHAFFVPDFRIKSDVPPGRYTTAWFEATKPGRYRLFCAEYCGTNHSRMIGWIDVMDPADYEAWLSGGAAEGSLADSGQKLFQQLACITCHKTDGSGRGPVLEGLYGKPVTLDNGQTVTVDDTYIRESILDSNAKIVNGYQRPSIMPTFKGLVNEEQLLQLIAYIKSIGPQQQGAGGAAPRGATQTPASPGTTQSNPVAPARRSPQQ
ncbi:MAG TPA: cytochrome c oxidase subunit II [Blastocatellia bacterium]|nr:cytochrome c oxidase subunit II [Blastocatellia bacterium]